MTLLTIPVTQDLQLAIDSVYSPAGFTCSQLQAEKESAEYAAHTLTINGKAVLYREAKITPTKVGQFVTLWKRIGKGPIQPFAITDDIDLVIISARNKNRFGQFIFPKAVLLEKGILSDKKKEGKRAIRVYPPWDKTVNKQAQKTQQWQLEFFLDLSKDMLPDLALAKKLLKQ